jgi:hypothetical protein
MSLGQCRNQLGALGKTPLKRDKMPDCCDAPNAVPTIGVWSKSEQLGFVARKLGPKTQWPPQFCR